MKHRHIYFYKLLILQAQLICWHTVIQNHLLRIPGLLDIQSEMADTVKTQGRSFYLDLHLSKQALYLKVFQMTPPTDIPQGDMCIKLLLSESLHSSLALLTEHLVSFQIGQAVPLDLSRISVSLLHLCHIWKPHLFVYILYS